MKQQYLNQATVQAFIEWLSERLTSNEFKHHYRNRRTGTTWQCSSLTDAYHQYCWPHSAFGSAAAGYTAQSNATQSP